MEKRATTNRMLFKQLKLLKQHVRLNTFIKNSFLLASVVLGIALCTNAHAAKMYKWVDKDGNISYQDSPPVQKSVVSQTEIKQPPAPSLVTKRSPKPISVYTIDDCISCEQLKKNLNNLGVAYREESLLERGAQARVLEFSDSLAAPALFIDSKLIIDLSVANLKAQLSNAGYTLAQDKGASNKPSRKSKPTDNAE